MRFSTLVGELTVIRRDELYEMDFPAYELERIPVTQQMVEVVGAVPDEAYLGRDLLCVFSEVSAVKALSPDQEKRKSLPGLLLQATAPGTETDCVSRTFAPKMGIAEDPVCGSGHCHIVPYWADRLQKREIVAYQASKREGTLYCSLDGPRVKLAGKAALYSEGRIRVPAE